jgi:dihydroxyacetone kinase
MPVLAAMSDVLAVDDVVAAVARLHMRSDGLRERLNAADRLLGDGDTGMTVASVVEAWQGVLGDTFADMGALFQQLGLATRGATGSSLGSVLAIGLVAAGKAAVGKPAVDRADIAAMLAAATRAISARSGAVPGDKSILDALIGMRESIEAGSDGALLDTAISGVELALGTFRTRESKLGRARIYGAKSVGRDDPGMLAAVELLRAARSEG